MPKAIVIVGPGNKGISSDSEFSPAAEGSPRLLAAVELLGASLIARVVQDLNRGGVESVAVVVDGSAGVPDVGGVNKLVRCKSQACWSGAMNQMLEYRDSGTDSVLLMSLGSYVEVDVAGLLQFSQESGEGAIRAFSQDEALDIWVVDPSRITESETQDGRELMQNLLDAETARFNVQGYVNHLEHPRDFRALVVDALNSRCRLRPQGFEVRPGVWMAEGAQVEKESRIVAPAFIGRNVTVSQQCLITRASSIERNSFVDYGTVIEDTSVLPNSYVGIGLDVCHSIVDGNKLLNLQREVLVEVEDPAVMRQNKPLAEAGSRWWSGFGKTELVPAADESAN